MNIIEYFIRRHLLNKLHGAEERLAALDELISHWTGFHTPNRPNVYPAYVIEELAKWKSERATLLVRKTRLEKELKAESKTQHDL